MHDKCYEKKVDVKFERLRITRASFETSELARRNSAAFRRLCHKIRRYFNRIDRAYRKRKIFAITSPIFVKNKSINGIPENLRKMEVIAA